MWLNSPSVTRCKGIQKIYDDVREYQPMIDAAFQCVANEIARSSIRRRTSSRSASESEAKKNPRL